MMHDAAQRQGKGTKGIDQRGLTEIMFFKVWAANQAPRQAPLSPKDPRIYVASTF